MNHVRELAKLCAFVESGILTTSEMNFALGALHAMKWMTGQMPISPSEMFLTAERGKV